MSEGLGNYEPPSLAPTDLDIGKGCKHCGALKVENGGFCRSCGCYQ